MIVSASIGALIRVLDTVFRRIAQIDQQGGRGEATARLAVVERILLYGLHTVSTMRAAQDASEDAEAALADFRAELDALPETVDRDAA